MSEEYESSKKYLENMKTQDMNKLMLLKNDAVQTLKIIDQCKKEYIQKFKQILEETK